MGCSPNEWPQRFIGQALAVSGLSFNQNELAYERALAANAKSPGGVLRAEDSYHFLQWSLSMFEKSKLQAFGPGASLASVLSFNDLARMHRLDEPLGRLLQPFSQTCSR